MSVISTKLTRRRSGGILPDGRTWYEIVYEVETNNDNDNVVTILNHFFTTGSLPWWGDFFTIGTNNDIFAFCVAISPSGKRSSNRHWWVPVRFEEPDTDGILGDLDPGFSNPLDFRCIVDMTSTNTSQPVYRAKIQSGFSGSMATAFPAGSELMPMNSLGQPFDPPVSRDVGRKVLRLMRNASAVNADQLKNNIVNSTAFNISLRGFTRTVAPLQARVNNWTARERRINDVWVWTVSCDMTIRDAGEIEPTWRQRVPDRGDMVAAEEGDPDGRGGTIGAADILSGQVALRRPRGLDGEELYRVRLDGNGKALARGAADAILEFQVDDEVDFTAIPFFSCFIPP